MSLHGYRWLVWATLGILMPFGNAHGADSSARRRPEIGSASSEATSAAHPNAYTKKPSLFGQFPPANWPSVDSFLSCLSDTSCIDKIPRRFFGPDLYNETLPDLIVFRDSKSRIRVRLVQGGGEEDDLFGAQHVWVLVFSTAAWELPISDSVSETKSETLTLVSRSDSTRTTHARGKETGPDSSTVRSKKKHEKKVDVSPKGKGAGATDTLLVDTKETASHTRELGREIAHEQSHSDSLARDSRTQTKSETKVNRNSVPVKVEVLQYRPAASEGVISAVARGIANVISGFELAEASRREAVKDTTLWVSLDTIPSRESKEILYFGMQKVTLQENTVNRISVGRSAYGASAYATFGNYSPSRIAASLAVGWTFDLREDTSQHEVEAEPFVFGHLFLRRQKVPAKQEVSLLGRVSYSLVFGLHLEKDHLFDDLVFGMGIGRVWGPMGVIIALNWRSETAGNHNLDRELKPLFALSLKL